MFVIIFLVSILFILTICLSSFYAVRPFYSTPIYVFVTILYCPSRLFYPYVCHHFILYVLFILLLCVCHPFYFRPCNVCQWPTISVANTPSFLGRRKPSKDAGRRPAIQRVCLKTRISGSRLFHP